MLSLSSVVQVYPFISYRFNYNLPRYINLLKCCVLVADTSITLSHGNHDGRLQIDGLASYSTQSATYSVIDNFGMCRKNNLNSKTLYQLMISIYLRWLPEKEAGQLRWAFYQPVGAKAFSNALSISRTCFWRIVILVKRAYRHSEVKILNCKVE